MKAGLRVIQYGVGAMGSNMVRLLSAKESLCLVGAIDIDKAKIGLDAGRLAGMDRTLGVTVGFPPEEVLDHVEADVVLHATTAFAGEAYPLVIKALDRGMNVVTITQELFYPLGENARIAKDIDALARKRGARITAVGVNPGFILDIVPIVGSLPCWEVDKVYARRVVDFSPYGPDEMRHIGAGLDRESFDRGVRDGTIGHIGLLETCGMVAHCLGIEVDGLRQHKEAIVTGAARRSSFVDIPAGRVCGFTQQVVGERAGEQVLDFNMVGIVSPQAEDNVELGDYIRITGQPSIDIRIKEEVAQKGGLGTAAVAVNIIPRLLEAEPGFHMMDTLAVPHFWRGSAGPDLSRIRIVA